MKTVLVGTTSINRSLLHKDNISDWYNYINTLDVAKYHIQWFINVDYIEKLGEPVQDTVDNFRNIITDIPIVFIDNNQVEGNFLKACKSISAFIEQYVVDNKLNFDDVMIFWLEDDWKLNSQNIPLQELIESYLSNMTYINLSFIRANYIHALAPSIISYRLWSKLHLAAWSKQIEHIDPEHCVGKYYLKHFGKYEDMYNVTLINQYKKHNAEFFNMSMFESEKSYYTYDVEKDENIILDKYIDKKDVIDFFNNKITFIRVTCTSCIDGVNYGRKFMKNYNIIKRRVQNNTVKDFYK